MIEEKKNDQFLLPLHNVCRQFPLPNFILVPPTNFLFPPTLLPGGRRMYHPTKFSRKLFPIFGIIISKIWNYFLFFFFFFFSLLLFCMSCIDNKNIISQLSVLCVCCEPIVTRNFDLLVLYLLKIPLIFHHILVYILQSNHI